METKKYSSEKIKNFLSKISNAEQKATMDDKTKDVFSSLSSWISEIPKEEGEITVKYDKDKLNENLKENEAFFAQMLSASGEPQPALPNQSKENTMADVTKLLSELADEKTTISEKENIKANLDTNYFYHKNIIDGYINIKEVEDILIKLISEENSISSIIAAIEIGSILIKRLITIPSILGDKKIELPNMHKFLDEFIKNFPAFFIHNDFRLRGSIINNIGNYVSYMLVDNFEDELEKIISLCFDEITTSSDIIIENIIKTISEQAVSGIQMGTSTSNPANTKNVTLDTSKNIFLEILRRVPLDGDNFAKVQKSLIEKSETIISKFITTKDIKITVILIASYEILFFYLNLPFYKKYLLQNVSEFAKKILSFLSVHVRYPSPQLRFWIFNFLISFNNIYTLKTDDFFMHNILPCVCLNRYLPVDGIKKNSMALWKLIVDMGGIPLMKKYYEDFLNCYVKELLSPGQVEKEAACRCLQEIIMKVYEPELHKGIVKKYHDEMIYNTVKCCRDPCWNVRESALIALGYVYSNVKEYVDDKPMIDTIGELIKYHCFDNVIEVRDASAFCLKIFLSYGGSINKDLKQFYLDCIKNLNNDDTMVEMHNAIKTEIFHYIPEKQDFGFMKEVSLDEFKDGIVLLIKELCEAKKCFLFGEGGTNIYDLAMAVIDYLCRNYNSGILSNMNKKSIWESLGVLFLNIEKSEVEMYFEYIVDVLIKELDKNLSSMCGYSAENMIASMVEGGISKRMIKGKVKNKIKGNEKLTNLFNKLLK